MLIKNKIRLFLPVAVLIIMQSCVTIKAPQIKSVENFNLESLSASPKMSFNLKLHNPNNFGLKITSIQTTVLNGDKNIAAVDLSQKTRIAANSDVSLPFNIQPSVKDVLNLAGNGIQDLLGNHSSDKVKVKGKITVRKFIFSKTFEFGS